MPLAQSDLTIQPVTDLLADNPECHGNLSTIVFYVLAFALGILFLCLAATKPLAMDHSLRVKAYLLLFIALLDFLVLLSTFPRRLGPTYYEAHDYIGVALYTYEFALSVWLITRQPYLRRVIFFAVQSGVPSSGCCQA